MEAKGLVPKHGSRGAKWVSVKNKQESLSKKGHEKTVTMFVEPGTIQWLESLSEDYWDMDVGEAGFPDGVFTKDNEPGAFGIGINLLDEFNEKVKKVTVE
ncbi:hypothetical protein HCH_03779 [Hahella chejuensis KCTC 2396]|uniref:Uncharacterized protein n=2 Tax=Hahella chejuensis TaxID=158327 RepID=Q2SFR3_HAHCH|nr:hypothetical protein HCH_03779 [Hahella chejuensis KCTC 2396]